MKSITYSSKTHGKYTILIDDEDFERVKDSGKWCVVIKRGNPYFQKRIDWTKETKGRVIELHRWLMGEPKGKYIDHINGNTLDNTRRNLRVCSNAANLRNGRIRTNNTSGMTGVSWNKNRGKWAAYIKVNYKTIWLGYFDTSDGAAIARIEAEKQYFEV